MRRLLGWFVAVMVLLVPGRALAQAVDLERLLAGLKDQDFRVRTQAALALGASKSSRARAPLCAALADRNVAVRAAAAAAIGRLGSVTDSCLEKQLEIETSDVVRAAIEKTLELVSAPRITESTEYYVAFAKLTDKSGRSGVELTRMVRSGLLAGGQSLEQFAFAPSWESVTRSKQRLARHPSLKAFYLSPRLPPFEYADGGLTVRLEVAMFSYPEKALIGNYTVRLTQPDVTEPDTASENDLVKMAAERAMVKFAKLAPTL